VVFNLDKHIQEIRPLLKPPVGNKLMFSEQLKVMIVGGPNQREEYHIEEGEELFYMFKGYMDLEIIEQGAKRCVRINEGEMFALPPRVPHSPQRYPDTIGLVWERERGRSEMDGLRWYTKASSGSVLDILYEEYFHCTDLGTQLKPIIEGFLGSESYATQTRMEGQPLPKPPVTVDTSVAVPTPIVLRDVLAALPAFDSNEPHVLFQGGEFEVEVRKGQSAGPLACTAGPMAVQEVFVYCLEGGGRVGDKTLAAGDVLYVRPQTGPVEVTTENETLLLCVYNRFPFE